MDTRFWGPPAWKLLHSIAAGYDASQVMRRNMELFLEVLPYVLPCKFCRASLTEHYARLPFKDALGSRTDLEQWMYKIHNLVNKKLEEQGQQILSVPTFRDVQKVYRQMIESTGFPSWDFLFSVAYIYPPDTKETPMPDAPQICPAGAPDCDRNRWNKLPSGKRLQRWLTFWKVLPDVLPHIWQESWISAWKAAHPSFTSRRSAVASIWRIRCAFESDKEDPYKNVCDRLTFHASGCGHTSSSQTKTCRRLIARNHTRKQR
jgi:hypothetical protein